MQTFGTLGWCSENSFVVSGESTREVAEGGLGSTWITERTSSLFFLNKEHYQSWSPLILLVIVYSRTFHVAGYANGGLGSGWICWGAKPGEHWWPLFGAEFFFGRTSSWLCNALNQHIDCKARSTWNVFFGSPHVCQNWKPTSWMQLGREPRHPT